MAVLERSVQDVIEQNMLDYGAYVILQRALPDLRDGLKPVYRRILVTMDNEDAYKLTKSANIEGAVMKLHPHGSAYGVMVNMTQKDRNQHPFTIGKGNFGQFTSRDLQPAASRYSEIKLSKLGEDVLKGLNKNLVDFVPNYDGTLIQPEVLPVKFPTILTQTQSGVALGMASSTMSFNLRELVNAMVKYIREGKKNLLTPDFATGGYIVNDKEAFKKINLEGKGSVILRGEAKIVGNSIEITQIPYSTTREAIIEKIADLVKSGKLKECSDAKDLTGLSGMMIEVKFKRGTDMNVAKEMLYQLTPLQSNVSANFNILVNKSPKVLGVWEIIKEWLAWRKSVIIRGLEFDIKKWKKDLHFLQGLEKVLLDIDKAIEIIRKSNDNEIEPKLIDFFKIDEIQAKEIADMKLRNINKDYIIKKIDEIKNLEEKIKYTEFVISDENSLNEIIIKDLEESSNKHGIDRMTKIIEVNNEKIKAVKKEIQAVPDYPVKLFITKEGYVKKLTTFIDQKDVYLKPGDEIVNVFETRNSGELLVFGNDKACYKIKIADIEDSTPKALGIFIPSICEVKKIVGSSINDGVNKFIIIVYDNNKIAKIKLNSFEGNRKKLANSLAKNLEVIGILTFADEGHFIFETSTSKFKIPTSKYELKERWTQGIYGPQKGIVKSIQKV